MARGMTSVEWGVAVRTALRGLAKRMKATGMVRYAEVEGQTLVTRFGVYSYRRINASNGETAGILQLDGRDLL